MRETTAAIGLFIFVCGVAIGGEKGYLVSAGLIRSPGLGFGVGEDSSFWNPKMDDNKRYDHERDGNNEGDHHYEDFNYEDHHDHHSPGHHHKFHHNHHYHHGFHHNHDDDFHNFHHDHHDHHRGGHHFNDNHDQWNNNENGYHHGQEYGHDHGFHSRNFESGKLPHFHNHDHDHHNHDEHRNHHNPGHHSFHNQHQPIESGQQGKGFLPHDEVHEDQIDDIQPKEAVGKKQCEIPSVVNVANKANGVGAIAEEENPKQTPNLVLDLFDSNSALITVNEDTSTIAIEPDNSADSQTPATVVTEKAADLSFSSADNDSVPKIETTTCISLEEKTVTPTISDYTDDAKSTDDQTTENSSSDENSADPTDTPRRGSLNEADSQPTAIDIRIDQGGFDFDSVNRKRQVDMKFLDRPSR